MLLFSLLLKVVIDIKFLLSYDNAFHDRVGEGRKDVVFTLQEMCCGFLLSREMWYRKSVLPGTGAG